MDKLRIIIWDICEAAEIWMTKYIQQDKVDVIAEISEDANGIKIEDANNIEGWDYLFIFAIGCRDLVDNVLRMCKIPEEKVIFPLELVGGYDHLSVLYGILNAGTINLIGAKGAGCRFLTCTVDGISYLGHSSDIAIMDYMVTSNHNWAKKEMHHFYELAKQYYQVSDREGIFCDIGANIGTTCIYFKKRIDSNVKILAFEPVQENYEMLRINTMLNHISEDDISLVNMGVSDIRQEGYMAYCEDNPGASSVVNSGEAGQKVQMMPFDDYLTEKGIDKHAIKYIWVDVEGFEGAFLGGAENTLKEIDVPIVMEFTPRFLMKSGKYEQFMNIVTKLYKSYVILQLENSKPRPTALLRKFPEENDEGDMVQFDIFLIK